MPWLSWPARLAPSRWSATSFVSASSLPMRRTIRLMTACRRSGAKLGIGFFRTWTGGLLAGEPRLLQGRGMAPEAGDVGRAVDPKHRIGETGGAVGAQHRGGEPGELRPQIGLGEEVGGLALGHHHLAGESLPA